MAELALALALAVVSRTFHEHGVHSPSSGPGQRPVLTLAVIPPATHFSTHIKAAPGQSNNMGLGKEITW